MKTIEKEKFIELYQKGHSLTDISKMLDVHFNTVLKWSKENSLELANIKNLKLQELQEKYFISKVKRLGAFGELFSKINKELSNRDLKKVPTDKLLLIFAKYVSIAKDEESQINFGEQTELNFDEIRENLNKTTISWNV